jgi:hypothetical protein
MKTPNASTNYELIITHCRWILGYLTCLAECTVNFVICLRVLYSVHGRKQEIDRKVTLLYLVEEPSVSSFISATTPSGTRFDMAQLLVNNQNMAVVGAPGYRSRYPGSIPAATRFSE